MNPISLQGRYRTRSGDPVRILCVDAEGIQPVIGLHGGSIDRWGADGTYGFAAKESKFDLIEVTPPPDSPLLAAARKVVEARHYSGDDGWDKLKNAIFELEGAINGQ